LWGLTNKEPLRGLVFTGWRIPSTLFRTGRPGWILILEPGSEAWMTLNRMGNAFEAAQEDEVAHPTGFFSRQRKKFKIKNAKCKILVSLRDDCFMLDSRSSLE
jgi:hypothetical protein